MSTSLKPVITDAGITALIDAKNRGVQAKITHVAVGDGAGDNGPEGYVANKEMTALKHEIQRSFVEGGELTGKQQNQLFLSATINDDGDNVPQVYAIYEIGFFLDNGVLFAIYSSAGEKLAEKISGTDFVLAFDLTLTGTEAENIIIDGSHPLTMPVARDNLLVGENTIKVHTQAEFDQVFNRGEDTEVAENLTIVLSPIQHTGLTATDTENQEHDLSSGAHGGFGDGPHNSFNGRPAYILKNSLLVKRNVSIIGFNDDDTVVIKDRGEIQIKLIGSADDPVSGVEFSGWSFDGRGGVGSQGGTIVGANNGGAIYLENVRQCRLNCRLVNHRTSQNGGAIYAVSALQIEARQVHGNQAANGGGVYGCQQSDLVIYECQASKAGTGAYACEQSQLRLFNCNAQACHESNIFDNSGHAYLPSKVGIGVESPDMPLMLRKSSDHSPVSITQSQVGGDATMELCTADGSSEQATRIMLRGSGDNTNVEFLSGPRGQEAPYMFMQGSSGNVGIGTTSPGSKLDVHGNVNISGNINITSKFTIGSKKPFIYKRYKNLGDSVRKNTGKRTTDYIVAIVGFRAMNGDINEKSTVDIVQLHPYEQDGFWYIRADFATHGNSETWDVDVLFIDRNLVEPEDE